MLVAERGVEYHRLGYQAKIDYWQEVEVMIIMIMMIFMLVMTHDDADVDFRLEENQADGRRCLSLWLMRKRLAIHNRFGFS